jgi:hypothetical protein
VQPWHGDRQHTQPHNHTTYKSHGLSVVIYQQYFPAQTVRIVRTSHPPFWVPVVTKVLALRCCCIRVCATEGHVIYPSPTIMM